MTLERLVRDVRKAAEARQKESAIRQMVQERVQLPEHLKKTKVECINPDMMGEIGHYVQIVGILNQPASATQHLLEKSLEAAQLIGIEPGIADFTIGYHWTPEAFRQKTRVGRSFFDHVNIEARAFICDPSKLVMQGHGQTSAFHAWLSAFKLHLQATGEHQHVLADIREQVQTRYAILHLLPEDRKKLQHQIHEGNWGKYIPRFHASTTEPVTVSFQEPSATRASGYSMRQIRMEKMQAPTRLLKRLEQALGKPLMEDAPMDQSHVAEFVKIYGAGGLMAGRRLKDLQYIVDVLATQEQHNTYGVPLITAEEAKEKLEQELETLQELYQFAFLEMRSAQSQRRRILQRLVRERFGREVLAALEYEPLGQYVRRLEQQGYHPPEKTIPKHPIIQNETNLLDFLLQAYDENPEPSVEAYRQHYVNENPSLDITAAPLEGDLAKLYKLSPPEHAQPYSFEISRSIQVHDRDDNHLSLIRTNSSSPKLKFRLCTTVANPYLLRIQEAACAELGISII